MKLSGGRPIFDWQSLPLALLLAASLIWIPKGDCEVEARMESQFERCCGLGISWASEGLRCEKFIGPVSGVPRVEQGLCLEAVDICCVRAYHEKSCEKGKEDARAGKACVQGEKPKNSPCPGEQHRDCCEGCKLGILTGSMGQGCAFKSFSFGKPWDPAFLECCHEASPTTTNTDTDSTSIFSTDTTMSASETSDASSSSTSSTSESDETSPDIPTPRLDDICELMKGLLCSDICVPTPGSFYCKCPEDSILLEDGKTCRSNSPEDRCKTNPCAHRCKDTGSEVICSCNPGFILAEDGHSCSPVSSRLGESSTENNDLDPRCPAGYKYNKTGQVCDDIDECENNPCPGNCKNLVGNFVCLPGSVDNDKESQQESCPPGYQWDGLVQRCTDIDECIVLDEACSQDTHLCVNTQGSFTCHELNGPKACPAGFKFDVAAKICKDVDECAEGIHGCLPGVEECRNTEGAYECDIKCRKGFSYSQSLDICVDVDECTATLHPCPDPKTHCVNIVGSYECKRLESPKKNVTASLPVIKTYTDNPISLNDENSLENDEAVRKVNVRTDGQDELEISSDYESFEIPDQDYMESSSKAGNVLMENTTVQKCPLRHYYNRKNRRCECQDESKIDPMTGNCRESVPTPTASPTTTYPDSEPCPQGYKRDTLTGHCVDIDECIEGPGCSDSERCGNLLGSYSCSQLCRPGWKFNSSTMICQDTDECALGQHNCPQDTHNCINTNGSYVCEKIADCAKGYYKIYNGKCVDIDECVLGQHNCPQGTHNCINTNGSYTCEKIADCAKGYYQTYNGKCVDIDECVIGQHNCPQGTHNCINTNGSYTCEKIADCTKGYHRTYNGKCVDVDECVLGQHNCPQGTHNCINTNGSYTCERIADCAKGYHQTYNGKCVDIDECVLGQHNCPQGTHNCINTNGSYTCERIADCAKGYHQTYNGKCVDIDECVLGQHNCPQGTHNCINTNGSYTCEKIADCAKGYHQTYNGKCVDIDECTEGPGCREHERCKNLQGSFDCSPLCSTGWHFDPLTKGCLDVDECLLGRHDCPQGTHRCVNVNGTYDCKLIPPCTSGFRKLFNGSCIDIDECAENLHDCRLSFHRYCVNREGTYECVTRYPECSKGFEYSLRSRTCEDIDECARSDYNCDSRFAEKCVNLPGSYKCERPPLAGQISRQRPACPSGFRYDAPRRHCSDVDECAEGLHSCGNEVCYNQPGGYTCARAPKPLPGRLPRPEKTEPESPVQRCQRGSKYVRNRGCIDINECLEDVEACTSNEECINTPGSFVCECKIGFRRDELTQACVDINECQLPENDCLSTQRCDNTVGSYNCVRHLPCGTGYTLNAATEICEDDDECILGTHDCSGGYHCRNTLGSYRCDRNPRIPQGPRVAASTTRSLAATTTPKSVFTSGPKTVCPRGFTHGYNGQCVDVDECLGNPNPCARSLQKCINTVGSFRCVSRLRCGDGYALDESGTHCVDVDECTDGSHECGPGQTCQNRQGGYLCKCPPGHAVGPDKQCIDVDECSIYASQRFANICGQNSRCENTVGSYRCICDPGFENVQMIGHGAGVCKDVDECANTPGLCQHNCLNAWGSYRCSCNPGFRLNADNRSCTDIDECTEFKQNNLCIGICENTPGSYACSCPAGYKLGMDERTCQDIDECASGRACPDPNEMCQNTRGGFRCNKINCPKGYYRDRERMNRCLRTSRYCPAGDLTCFRAPMHYSYNFITFVSMIPIPSSGQLELFTMRSTHPPGSTVQFSMALVDARGPPGVIRATESCFALKRPAPSQAVLVLTRSISGPQEIELDLSMEIYHDTAFAGSAVAKLLIFVSEYEY